MAKIFVSYRREDSPGHTGRLYDHLVAHFGEQQVFRDIEAIELGVDFVDAIQEAVGSCDILVAVIGREWLTIRGKDGQRRLDNPKDFVRLEIAAALARDIRVIPVLVENAAMPSEEELPPDLATLARRNAIEVDDTRFRTDIDRLIHSIQLVVPELRAVEARAPAEATFVAGSRAEPRVPPPPPPKRSHKGVVVGLLVVLLALAALVLGSRLLGFRDVAPGTTAQPQEPVAKEPALEPETGTGGSGTAGQEEPAVTQPEEKPPPPPVKEEVKEEVVRTPPRPRPSPRPVVLPPSPTTPQAPVEQPPPSEVPFDEEVITPPTGTSDFNEELLPGGEQPASPPAQDPSFDEEIIQ